MTNNGILGEPGCEKCIFEKALNTNADALVGGLICSVLNTVLKLMGPFGTIERNIIKEITDAIGIEFCSS